MNLTIISYEDISSRDLITKEQTLDGGLSTKRFQSFTVQVNPESYMRKVCVDYDNAQSGGTTGSPQRFVMRRPDTVSFSFYLDGTGGVSNVCVKDQVKKFQDLTVKYQGNIHKPRDLEIIWGDHLNFKCVLTKLDIEYLRFNKSGDPTRAKLSCEFHEKIPEDIMAAEERSSSPDLTQTILVKEGDTLDLLSYKVYNDSRYYLEVARANNLINFRKLVPGQKLVFPPLSN